MIPIGVATVRERATKDMGTRYKFISELTVDSHDEWENETSSLNQLLLDTLRTRRLILKRIKDLVCWFADEVERLGTCTEAVRPLGRNIEEDPRKRIRGSVEYGGHDREARERGKRGGRSKLG